MVVRCRLLKLVEVERLKETDRTEVLIRVFSPVKVHKDGKERNFMPVSGHLHL